MFENGYFIHPVFYTKIMYKEGFANYFEEWWHFSYGDQLWATYRYKRYAIYGSINRILIEEYLDI